MVVPITMNQVVARNVAEYRKRSRLTQAEAAEQVWVLGGPRWSVAAWSAAERSGFGGRVRQFDADLLVALAGALCVTVVDLLTPPEGELVGLGEEGRVVFEAGDIESVLSPLSDDSVRESPSPLTPRSKDEVIEGLLRIIREVREMGGAPLAPEERDEILSDLKRTPGEMERLVAEAGDSGDEVGRDAPRRRGKLPPGRAGKAG